MRAIVMQQPGPPEVLQPVEVPMPEIRTGDGVLIRLQAAGINPIDAKLRSGGSYYPHLLPTILGCDGAGIVEAVGPEVRRFAVGDPVYWFYGGIGGDEQGNYAEWNCIPERYLAPAPIGYDLTQAAATPLALITAWESLHLHGAIKAGQTVLIHAGAGGVGHIAIQLAKLAGCRVLTTVSSSLKADFVTQLGADLPILYREQEVAERSLEATQGRGVDLVLDCVGGNALQQSFACLRPYGQLVTLLAPAATTDWRAARQKNLKIAFELMLSPPLLGLEQQRIQQTGILEQGARWIESGQLQIHLQATFPLDQAAEAHRILEAGGALGKMALKIA